MIGKVDVATLPCRSVIRPPYAECGVFEDEGRFREKGGKDARNCIEHPWPDARRIRGIRCHGGFMCKPFEDRTSRMKQDEIGIT
jgi:hypothetical protein